MTTTGDKNPGDESAAAQLTAELPAPPRSAAARPGVGQQPAAVPPADAARQPAETQPAGAGDAAATPAPSGAVPPPPLVAARREPRMTRTRVAAVAAAVLLLGGGVAGYAIGAAGDHRDGGPGRHQQDGFRGGDGPGAGR